MLALCAAAIAELPRPADPSVFQIVRQFDFDERRRGNYEDLPMFWRQLTGPGLPRYSTARLDDEVGRDAAPALRFDLRGGNIGLEYFNNDLQVVTEADYRIVGYIRTEGLAQARAFVVVYFVDRIGGVLPDSLRVSDLRQAPVPDEIDPLASGASEPPPSEWMPIEITVGCDDPRAFALRVQLWVAQDYTWQPPRPGVVDPIVREDVAGRAWFDDLTIYRLPRVRLAFSDAAGILVAPQQGALQLSVQNPTDATLTTTVHVRDERGETVAEYTADAPPRSAVPLEHRLPALPLGHYVADAQLYGSGARLLSRRVRFSVVADVSDPGWRSAEFGVDLGRFPGGPVEGLRAALRELRVGAVKVGVPMIGPLDDADELAYFDGVRTLAGRLATAQIESCGIILAPARESGHIALTTRQLVDAERALDERFGPALAYLSGTINTWQLGDEAGELDRGVVWDADAVRRLRSEFEKFLTLPRFVQPASLYRPALQSAALAEALEGAPFAAARPSEPRVDDLPGVEVQSIYVPGEVPARALPWHLAFLVDDALAERQQGARAQRWLRFGLPDPDSLTPEDRIADLAYRIVFARALGAERAYFPAPLELDVDEGQQSWSPLPTYPAMRTLFRFLAGKTAVRVMPLGEVSQGVLFRGDDEDVLVAWTWRAGETVAVSDRYLGERVNGRDLWAREVPLRIVKGRTELKLTTLPFIVQNVDTPLIELQAGLSLAPTEFEPHDPRPRMTFRIENPYPDRMTGMVELTPPRDWSVSPARFEFSAAPGEVFEQIVHVTIPPLELAANLELGLQLQMFLPDARTLELSYPIGIGLTNIEVTSKARWRGQDLILEYTLRNRSDTPLNFSSFCQAPARRRQSGAFLNVAPGEIRTLQYIVAQAENLRGHDVILGVEEISGRRRLSHRVPVPADE